MIILTVCFETIFLGLVLYRFQFIQSLMPILLYQAGESLMSFFFDNTWTSNVMASNGCFTVIHPFSMSIKRDVSRTTQEPCRLGDAVLSRSAIKFHSLSMAFRSAFFPITSIFKHKNYSPDSRASVKNHTHLIKCPPLHPGEFITKYGDTLADWCISCSKILSFISFGKNI